MTRPMVRARRVMALLFVCALAGACADDDAPVHVYQYGANGGAATDLGMRTVMRGDTPYTIAKAYDIAPEDIIAANHLSPPYRLAPGQRLRIPPPSRYTTQAGDTIYSVSRTFNVSETQIARLNHLQAPYNLSPGENLRLPSILPQTAAKEEIASAAPPDNAVSSAASGGVYNPPPPVIHYYTPSPKAPAAPGEEVAESGKTQETVAPAVLNPLPPPAEKGSRAANGDTLIAESETPVEHVADEKPGTFSRPVAGPIISGYGDKPNGLHNDGINIKAPAGTPVHAAAGGEVVYASDQLKGFGNLVLIRHADRWLTAYAHLDTVKVKRGDHVGRGQVIGTVGQTGAVDSPQLHFEVRRGTEALNPAGFLTAS